MRNNSDQDLSYTQKIWIQAGIFALVVVVLLVGRATFNVMLLILAGCLIAIFFRAIAGIVQRKTGLKEGLSLTIAIIGTLLIISALLWLISTKVQQQVTELTDSMPAMLANAKAELSKTTIGQRIVEKISSPASQKKAETIASTFFRSSFGVLGDLYVVLFIGIFLTASPRIYTKGIVSLVPKTGRPKAESVMDILGEKLKKWLKGQLLAMLIVFALTAIGLVAIGVPMWLTLAIIAGVLNFVPNFGPLIAMIPAILVGLSISPVTALIVAGLYILVQVVESNLITPMIQKKMVNMPPALIIIAQLLVAPLTSGWGLVLATPLVLIIRTVVQELYIKKQDADG